MNYVIDKIKCLVSVDIQEVAFNAAHPVGEIYIQFPGKSDPQTLYGRGTWDNISSQFAGLFFRAEGGNAAEFYTGTINGSNVLPEDNKQEDKIRGITGDFPTQGNYFTNRSTSRGAFITTKKNVVDGGDSNDANYANEIHMDVNVDTGNYGNPMAGHADGPEIRPVNTTIRIWERTS